VPTVCDIRHNHRPKPPNQLDSKAGDKFSAVIKASDVMLEKK